jgi:hypothetical protein
MARSIRFFLLLVLGATVAGCAPVDSTPVIRDLLGWVDDVGDAISRMLVLFVFGTVLLALATERMEKLELEVAARPMRAFAAGLVGALVAASVVLVLCVTVVGIPVALVVAMILVIAGYAGLCAVLVTVGGALIRHRTDNVYVHLALGCGLFLVLGSIPWIGSALVLALALTGFGAVVASRCAGLVSPRREAPNQWA